MLMSYRSKHILQRKQTLELQSVEKTGHHILVSRAVQLPCPLRTFYLFSTLRTGGHEN